MKKILSCLFVSILILTSNSIQAQSNNPFNKNGVDYYASLQIITEDYNSGIVKEINEESLQKYSDLVPLKGQMTVSLATQVFNSYKSAVNSNDINTVLSNSTLSTATKNQLMATISRSKTLSNVDYAAYFSSQVNEINGSSSLTPSEKEMLLTINAIIYNSPMWSGISPNGSISSGKVFPPKCTLFGQGGSVEISGGACIVAGAIVGGLVGYVFCGIPCMIGGAIIGGVMGAISS